MTRTITLLTAAALLATACGAGAAVPPTTGGAPTTQGPTTTTPPVVTTTQGPTTTTPVVTTTTQGPTTTTQPVRTTTPPAPGTTSLSVYFFLDDTGQTSRPGPFLVPVRREVARTQAVATVALSELLAGPTPDERSAAISSAIPDRTLLLGLTIDDGVATVDLSREFESGGGSMSMFGRIAQVVYTLTQFSTVEQVLFRLDGEPVEVFSGEGILLADPVGRDDYLDMVPTILVDRPAYGGELGNPARLVGVAIVFEATFQVAIVDADGVILAETTAMTDEGNAWGDFDVTIPYQVERPQMGSLIVWVYSARDGSQIDTREYPVWLTPGAG